jgi:hypothetical protein
MSHTERPMSVFPTAPKHVRARNTLARQCTKAKAPAPYDGRLKPDWPPGFVSAIEVDRHGRIKP